MKKEIKIATSPLSNTIYAGTLLKDGRTWSAGKQDVTIDALCAVADHVIRFGQPVTISDADGNPVYQIKAHAGDELSLDEDEEEQRFRMWHDLVHRDYHNSSYYWALREVYFHMIKGKIKPPQEYTKAEVAAHYEKKESSDDQSDS